MDLEKISFFKKGERKLTPFFSQYLGYDYLADKLDSERKKAFEEELITNQDLKLELQKIQIAKNYLNHLSKMQVSEELGEHFRSPKGYLRLLVKKIGWDDWPDGLKLGLESLTIIFGVLLLSLVVPWGRFQNIKWSRQDFVVLSEFNKSNRSPTPEVATSTQESLKFTDEGPLKTETPAKENPVTPQPPESAKATNTIRAEAEQVQQDRRGFLYRGQITVTNSDSVSAKFIDKISELGGRKAGDVPLGWSKPTGKYFHFTIPESKYAGLQEFAKDFGELNITKEKHDRVMPTGIIRIIIDIKEKNKPVESPAPVTAPTPAENE